MNGGSERRPALRASDAERERAVLALRDAVGEGRLSLEEFSGRVELALTARTDNELAELVRDLPDDPAPSTAPSPAKHHRAFCSHLARNGSWSLPRHSSWRAIFGTIDLDLRQARLDGSETVLQIYNFFGTVTVIVPEGIDVVVHGGGLFASQDIESPERPPIPDGPRVTIDARGPGGTLHVRTRPAATLMQAIKGALTR